MLSKDEDRCVHGTCIWFSDEKGYGFLLSDDGVSSMVHYTDIKEPGFKRLYRGQRVTYEELETEKGRSARRVKYVKDLLLSQIIHRCEPLLIFEDLSCIAEETAWRKNYYENDRNL